VICADTDAEAAALEKAVDLRRVQMALGLNAPIPSIEQGGGQEYGARELAIIEHEKARSIIGTPDRVADRVRALQSRFKADELIVLTVAGSYAARLRSYELLADAFDLQAQIQVEGQA
jgi:alkanesulfonate monooxygenase SsuD/methylene tetrahydromethanopterin reductase-like flavin-dependent oxidoreductase (luciferase family)